MIKIFAVSGFKKSGKSTLCRKILAELSKMGIRTGYIKRTSDEVLDLGENDTGRVLNEERRTALWGSDGVRYEERESGRFTPDYIASHCFPDAEIVIMEGGKFIDVPKIWVENGTPRPDNVKGVFMIYDRFRKGDGKMTFTEGDEKSIAEHLASSVRGDQHRSANVYIGDKPLPMKDFIADFIRGGLLGMLSSLKGADTKKPVLVYLEAEKESKK